MAGNLGGYRTVDTKSIREPMYDEVGKRELDVVIDASKSIDGDNSPTHELRAGMLMARITASGLWVPCKRTTISANTESSSQVGAETEVTVTDAVAFKVGDVITLGNDTGRTIVSITYATNKITVDGAIAVSDGEAVYTTDGSQTCRGVLLSDNLELEDEDDNEVDCAAVVAVSGGFRKSVLIGDWDAIKADTNAVLGSWKVFDGAYPIT